MFEIVEFSREFLAELSDKVRRDQLHYHEYKFLETEQLKAFFINKRISALEHKSTYSFVAFEDSQLLGFISATKDEFDSENFGFSCFKVTELMVFSNDYNEINKIFDELIKSLENKVLNQTSKVYFSISLNNNLVEQDKVFNSLVRNNFYYIHTLLTFGLQGDKFESLNKNNTNGLIIRVAKQNDAEAIAQLAQKSFSFSRFHLDPFLDNQKANKLLFNSARNSVLYGFVDVMFVAEKKGDIVGYYSAKKKHINELNLTIGDAVISAVDSNFQGLGIFTSLDTYLLNWFAENVNIAEMGTYLINHPVHKTWIKKGLHLVRGVHQFSKLIEK